MEIDSLEDLDQREREKETAWKGRASGGEKEGNYWAGHF